MYRKTVIQLGICLLFSVMTMGALYIRSEIGTRKKNGFKRVFVSPTLIKEREISLEKNNYYISGITSEIVYLANTRIPNVLLRVNYHTSDTQKLRITTLRREKLSVRTTFVSVDSPYVYLKDGSLPAIFTSKLPSLQIEKMKIDSTPFSECLPLSPTLFAVRLTNLELNQNIIARQTLYPHSMQLFPNMLEKQSDGIFCTDGMMLYNKKNGYIIYLYYYRNTFICLDTSFHVVYKGHTIDTVSTANINVQKIKSEHQLTMSEPPPVVNKRSYTNSDFIFVNSSMVADNENRRDFNRNSVIDVYSIDNGKYKFSFYVPDLNGVKMDDFRYLSGRFIALYGSRIVTYRIPEGYSIF